MTMHKTLQPRDDVDRLYVSRKEGVRRLGGMEESIDVSIQQIEDYIDKRRGRLITAKRNNIEHFDLQNGNDWKTKNGRKSIVWMI